MGRGGEGETGTVRKVAAFPSRFIFHRLRFTIAALIYLVMADHTPPDAMGGNGKSSEPPGRTLESPRAYEQRQ
jgi:hypothetical protein